MFPIDFSTIFPSISSPLSPQGDIQTYDDYGDNGDGDHNVIIMLMLMLMVMMMVLMTK